MDDESNKPSEKDMGLDKPAEKASKGKHPFEDNPIMQLEKQGIKYSDIRHAAYEIARATGEKWEDIHTSNNPLNRIGFPHNPIALELLKKALENHGCELKFEEDGRSLGMLNTRTGMVTTNDPSGQNRKGVWLVRMVDKSKLGWS